MPHHCYSPYDRNTYRLFGVRDDEVTVITNDVPAQYQDAVWNLFWLSVPSLDNLIDIGPAWPSVYTPINGGLAAVIADAIEDEVLYRKVMMHPDAFLDWFERESDYTIFDCFDILGGMHWVETVTNRADEAARRITSAKPPVHIDKGVVHVDFRRIAAS